MGCGVVGAVVCVEEDGRTTHLLDQRLHLRPVSQGDGVRVLQVGSHVRIGIRHQRKPRISCRGTRIRCRSIIDETPPGGKRSHRLRGHRTMEVRRADGCKGPSEAEDGVARGASEGVCLSIVERAVAKMELAVVLGGAVLDKLVRLDGGDRGERPAEPIRALVLDGRELALAEQAVGRRQGLRGTREHEKQHEGEHGPDRRRHATSRLLHGNHRPSSGACVRHEATFASVHAVVQPSPAFVSLTW